MRARAREQKREASQTSVRSKRRGSRQLHRQRHRLQRDQVERQALLGRFRASSTPESVKAVSTKSPIIRQSCDEAAANPPRNRNGFCARYANQFPRAAQLSRLATAITIPVMHGAKPENSTKSVKSISIVTPPRLTPLLRDHLDIPRECLWSGSRHKQ
jgi:hypothetical protein